MSRPAPALGSSQNKGAFLVWVLLLSLLWLGPLKVWGLTFYDTADTTYNTTAPTGLFQDSGWGYLGYFGSFLGTKIGPQHFITAKHIGNQGSTFIDAVEFNGMATQNQSIDASANGGVGYWDIAGTDLRIYKINGTFNEWASLYTGTEEAGHMLVTFGRGGTQGTPVMAGSTLKGWRYAPADGVARWGVNEVIGAIPTTEGPMILAYFDSISGISEATLAPGDSGGPVFIYTEGVWKLAGINYGINLYDTNAVTGDSSEFLAALFDVGGYYTGSDSAGWTYIPDQTTNIGSTMYASRISSSASTIQGIVPVPEPGSAMLTLFAAAWTLLHGRNRRQITG